MVDEFDFGFFLQLQKISCKFKIELQFPVIDKSQIFLIWIHRGSWEE